MEEQTSGDKDLTYTAPNGDEVYGFTQSKKNADEIIRQQKRNNTLLVMQISLWFLFLLTIAYVVYRIEQGNIIANIVARCVC